jgi:transposase
MALELLPDDLWEQVEPLLPRHPPHPKGGHPFANDRGCLLGILFVLRTGSPWQMIPQELGTASGSSCWRRLRDWTAAGVWPEVHRRLLSGLGKLGKVDLSHAVIDSASVRAVFGGRTPAPTLRIGAKTAANAT